jgi:predicted RNA-binding Zn ribbon-like protein
MSKTHRIELQPPTGESFSFDPGADCLCFAMTGGEGWRSVYETLHAPEDLDTWLRRFVGAAVEPASATDLTAAKRFRAAIWRAADARADGTPLPRDAVEQINRTASLPPLAPRIDQAEGRAWALPTTPSQVMATLARDAVDLLTGPPGRIRRCAGTNCHLIFVDSSRPGRRRWCSMERCGNRAKVHTFRARQHKEQAP